MLCHFQVNFKCEAGHVLRFWQQAPYDSDDARCSTCDGRINFEQGYLRCQRCDFNQCTTCQYKKLREQRELDRKAHSQYSVYPVADTRLDGRKVSPTAVHKPKATKAAPSLNQVNDDDDSMNDSSLQLPMAEEVSPNSRRVRFEGRGGSTSFRVGSSRGSQRDPVQSVVLDSTGGDCVISVRASQTASTATASDHKAPDEPESAV